VRVSGLVRHLAVFAQALRERGIPVALSDEADALAALTLVDVADRAEVRRALRVALKVRRRHAAAFDELFERLWAPESGEAATAVVNAARDRRVPHGRPARRLAAAGAGDGERGERDVPSGDAPAYSPEALLRRKSFEECTPEDLAAMERLLSGLASRLATRPSRRLVPTRGRGRHDPRRSFRRALATDGEFLEFARRSRAIEEPRLVVLCDTSGSMDAHARFLLAFILSLGKTARRTEAFAFNTSLTRITPLLAAGKVAISLDRLSAGVPDWSGGTRIGECLAAFVEQHLQRVVRPGTTVVVLSDGLDRGDPAVLAEAMRAIRARARKVIWLNPLMGDERYRPLARGMEAALPFVDHLAPAHNLESFERFLTLVPAW